MTDRNIFEGAPLDRVGIQCKDESWVAAQIASPDARVLPVWRAKNLVSAPSEDSAEGGADIPTTPISLDMTTVRGVAGPEMPLVLLGLAGTVPIFAADLSPIAEPLEALGLTGKGNFADLRDLAAVLDRGDSAVLAYARALTHWHSHNRFCAKCGSATASTQAGRVRQCTNADCATHHFPRTDPAVIMLVTQGDSCMLARRTGRNPPVYSTLAGFVEPGESLEEAVAREVMEEVGLSVRDIRYQSSQPWPFPAQLMLGFRAEATARECHYHDDEIEDARWFTRAELRGLFAGDANGTNSEVHLPRSISIARRLIREWVNEA
jgi:NAD+ diphosphatase